MDEQEAVRRCQSGDREAFRHLVETHQRVLMGTAYLMTRNRAEAEEFVQDALLSAWQGMRGFRNGSPVKPWLVRILVNRIISHRRRGALQTVPIVDGVDPSAGDPTPQADERDAMNRAIATLPEEQRQAVLLRYYADLSVAEIAASLGWPEGTVKSRLHRALGQLREVLTV